MVNIIIRYDTNVQHVIHSFPSLPPSSQKCRINILLKITTYVLKSSLLLQNFPTQTVWGPAKCETNQVAFWSWGIGSINIVPSKSALSADNFVIQHISKFWKKPGKLWFAPFLKIWLVSQNIGHVDYEFYVLLYILTNMKTCGKVANTKSWIVMFSKKTPVYSGHWTIGILQNRVRILLKRALLLQNRAGILQNWVGI